MPEWSGQILEQARPRFEAFTVAGYVLGVAFREQSRPERYRDLRSAMRRAAIPARVRVHREDGMPCVAAHFDAGPALRVAELVRAGLVRATPPP
ncbi:MAG: hypothetical protein IT373_23510 [Polyangiaceae bacterium]|nr:hypothetical protein [Polyangiaceae bacterium]